MGSVGALSILNVGYVNNLPQIQIPDVRSQGIYEPWGARNSTTYPLLPTAEGFDGWNNKLYSGKELDVESRTYHYGVRNYDSSNAVWNRADDYKGNITNPASRNRYSFVEGNPVNNIDLYGFAALSISPVSKSSTLNCNTPECIGLNKLNTQALINNDTQPLQGQISNLNADISTLTAQAEALRWSSYNAMVSYYDHVVMNIIIGRLQERGYEMNYNQVFNYLSNKVQEKAGVWSYYQGQQSSVQNAISDKQRQITDLQYRIDNVNPYTSGLNGNSIANFLKPLNINSSSMLDGLWPEASLLNLSTGKMTTLPIYRVSTDGFIDGRTLLIGAGIVVVGGVAVVALPIVAPALLTSSAGLAFTASLPTIGAGTVATGIGAYGTYQGIQYCNNNNCGASDYANVGIGAGLTLYAGYQTVSTYNTNYRSINTLPQQQITLNRQQGAEFETVIKNQLEATRNNVAQQITLKTNSGIKTRVDFVVLDQNLNVKTIYEAKSSSTAPLTANQSLAFPEIQQSGAVVVGKGQYPLTEGVVIPPTEIIIIRPNNK